MSDIDERMDIVYCTLHILLRSNSKPDQFHFCFRFMERISNYMSSSSSLLENFNCNWCWIHWTIANCFFFKKKKKRTKLCICFVGQKTRSFCLVSTLYKIHIRYEWNDIWVEKSEYRISEHEICTPVIVAGCFEQ